MTDVCFRLYVESKRFILTEAKQRMVMARSWGKGKWGGDHQRVQSFSSER